MKTCRHNRDYNICRRAHLPCVAMLDGGSRKRASLSLLPLSILLSLFPTTRSNPCKMLHLCASHLTCWTSLYLLLPTCVSSHAVCLIFLLAHCCLLLTVLFCLRLPSILSFSQSKCSFFDSSSSLPPAQWTQIPLPLSFSSCLLH